MGLYFLRARYYDPNNGRFLNQDTFEGKQDDPTSLHKYLYTGNNPVDYIDPSGNEGIVSQVILFAIKLTLVTASVVLGTLASSQIVVAPTNDPYEDNVRIARAEVLLAELNLLSLIFALWATTLHSVTRAPLPDETAGLGHIGAGPRGPGRFAPYNPSGGFINCPACVTAYIKTLFGKKRGALYTADDLPPVEYGSHGYARNTTRYISENADVLLTEVAAPTQPGTYVTIYEPTAIYGSVKGDRLGITGMTDGHVVVTRNLNNRVYVYDPQTHRYYTSAEAQSAFHSRFSATPRYFKVTPE